MKRSWIALTALVAVACGASSSPSTAVAGAPPNTDPKQGWAKIFPDDPYDIIEGRCKGSNLILKRQYNQSGIAAIQNAAECR